MYQKGTGNHPGYLNTGAVTVQRPDPAKECHNERKRRAIDAVRLINVIDTQITHIFTISRMF